MNAYLKAIGIGALCGMRSMSGPAIVSSRLAGNSRLGEDPVLGYLVSKNAAGPLAVLAAGEMAADKFPFIPDRIAPGPIAGRAVSGALCGAAVCVADEGSAGIGAVAGAAAAVASAFAFFTLRKKLGETTGIPDALVGLAEDAVVLAAGSAILPKA